MSKSTDTYDIWLSKIQHLKDKVILPDGRYIYKTAFITPKGFDIEGFNELLKDSYNNTKYL